MVVAAEEEERARLRAEELAAEILVINDVDASKKCKEAGGAKDKHRRRR